MEQLDAIQIAAVFTMTLGVFIVGTMFGWILRGHSNASHHHV